MPFGTTTIFFPEATEDRCTMAMLLEIDSVGLVRKKNSKNSPGTLAHYVNDRQYAASSFLSTALGKAFGTAMSGRCKDKPELVDVPLRLEVSIPALPCRGEVEIINRIFEPLGYDVSLTPHVLDERFPEWGDSPYFSATISGEQTVQNLLSHFFVLIPVLDNQKHYWVGKDEVEKLLRKGEAWLANHPEKELITSRYLRYSPSLVRDALQRLIPEELVAEEDESTETMEEVVERPIRLNQQRYNAVSEKLLESGCKSVIDLGCGSGKLLRQLSKEKSFNRVVGMDVSYRALEMASRRLRLDTLSERQKKRIDIFQSSLMYFDERIAGFDGACVVEVIEHMDPPRLKAFEENVFGGAKPSLIVVTTPNIEYNENFETLEHGKLRHRDHRFEWTRDEFQTWAESVCVQHSYSFEWSPIGEEHPETGPPTQMISFTLKNPSE
jgi:3' terminal RNA ribose 2'-O-methyltransferase Hen1